MLANYDLEIKNVIARIKADNAKIVCLQFPDGLKPHAESIIAEIKKETPVTIITWLGSCWGACDVPLEVNRLGVDLLIQWGHSEGGH